MSIFHLSLPVLDLEETRDFYCSVLGASPGRSTSGWIDLILFGHQLTFHRQPEQVRAPEAQGVQHFGAILPWEEWEGVCASLQLSGYSTLGPPSIFEKGTELEHGKVLLRDPSGHLIELKAYRDVSGALGAIITT